MFESREQMRLLVTWRYSSFKLGRISFSNRLVAIRMCFLPFLELHLMTTCYDDLFMSYLKAVMLISTRFMQLMSGDWCTMMERLWITKLTYIAAITIFLLVSPLLVSVLTLGSCLLLNIDLTAGRVFTAMATFRILQDPFRQFLQTMMQAAQALVSLNRLLKFFQSGELDLTAVEKRIQGQDGYHEFASTVHVSSYTLLLTLKHIAIWMTNLKCKDMKA